MKKVLIVFLVAIAVKSDAQMVVNDPVNTKLLVLSNMYTNASATYTQLGAQMAQGTLSQVTQGVDIATRSLDLLKKAVDVANIFMGSQVTLDFFNNQRRVLDKIRSVSRDMNNIPVEILRPNVRKLIVDNLDDGFVTATKSLQVAKNAFVQQQLNLTERLTYIEAANKYLEEAQQNITKAVTIITNAKMVSSRLKSRQATIKMLY